MRAGQEVSEYDIAFTRSRVCGVALMDSAGSTDGILKSLMQWA
jgi:hypothetical protein